jgi:uncharacterized protein DUF29
MTDRPEHDDDLVAWAEAQAEALRAWQPRVEIVAGRNANLPALDWRNIIAEIEELARSHRRELASRISTVLVHLLKLAASPATDPVPGWRTTVREQRNEIRLLLEDAPSLAPKAADVIAAELPAARYLAGAALADQGETPTVDLSTVDLTADQVLGDWWPR